jgi:hypothetical protein
LWYNGFVRKKESIREKRKEKDEYYVFIQQFPTYSPLDQDEILTTSSRHIALNSKWLDGRVVSK